MSGSEEALDNGGQGYWATVDKAGGLGFLQNRNNGGLFEACGDYRLFQAEVECLLNIGAS